TEAAQPQHAHSFAAARAAVPQRVVSGDARAHQRSSLYGRQILRHRGQRNGGSHHVIRVTAIEGDARDLEGHLAAEEITAPARIAIAAMTAVPADAHALAGFP